MKIDVGKAIGAWGSAFLAGAVGSYATMPAIESWYKNINKSTLTPPNYVFGPVWTTLYILMGLAAYLVWTTKGKKKKLGTTWLYFGQLVLNTLWSIVFFGMKSPEGGFVVIGLLWATILIMILRYFKINKIAAYVLVPYLLWVSLASWLNFEVMLLN
jgi:tryptophan-rich sensory protein